ncbi:S-layer glycoprotein N-glycosyltransferase AglJ [Halobacteria archaeon AArc-m2/3/4]|uniref:S-layer glycoprotein N-glycosyltransferase AglJ n=1 Tax=Natronoglomus mannanivorans TaxID=2979990 RepID=A0AAP2Z3T2_9EURY|nr:S-layer glycoprotein N-glycosyltransferase AglJ [Halobacteria archaeon AArc-xg1-1]MCU4972999.1 S-layer glycoprotein N-glycosyltransferase AglJ [Halobacteria archaeon AArc-m2/3/4]
MDDDAIRGASFLRTDGAVTIGDETHEIAPSSVCVLVPTLNEAATIGDVIDGFAEYGYTNVLVVDGDSDDDTRELARDHGARVLTQSGAGKGQAVREALEYVDVPYVLMVDGDGTYDPADADRMLEPLTRGYEHVIGNRFADMDDDAMRRLNGFGNRMINGAFRFIHGHDYDDILSGYRAFTTESFRRLSLSSDGFTIETELAVECVKHDVDTTVVPISYAARPDDSETNLHPVWDGGTIVLTLYSLAKTNNPLFYFGSLGAVSVVSGLGVAAYVLSQWIWYSEGHEIMALVSAAGILLGVQLLMFGVLSDMIVSLHREQRRRLERITRESSRDRGRERERERRDSPGERTNSHDHDHGRTSEIEADSSSSSSSGSSADPESE